MSDLTVADDLQSSAPRRHLVLDEQSQFASGDSLCLFSS